MLVSLPNTMHLRCIVLPTSPFALSLDENRATVLLQGHYSRSEKKEGIPEREVAKTWEDREITVPKIQHRIIARVAHCNLSVS